MYKPFCLIMLISVAALSCGRINNPILTKENAEWLNGGFEMGSLAFWGKEIAREESAQVCTFPVYQGNYAAKLTLWPGDFVCGGHRIELTRTWEQNMENEMRFSWHFMIDHKYIDDHREQIIHQFHDYPDYDKGETWESSPGYTPPILTAYKNDTIFIKRHIVGYGQETIGRIKIEKGKWINIEYLVKWSVDYDGYFITRINGEYVTPFNGTDHRCQMPTMFNRFGNYLKIGLYRNPDIRHVNTVYIDELTVSYH